MGNHNITNKIIILLLSTSLISCAGNMEGANEFLSQNSQSNVVEPEPIIDIEDSGVSQKTQALINEVNEAELQTEPAYREIEKQEKKIKTLDILSFLLALPFKASTGSEASQKLKNPIKSVLGKIKQAVDKAYSLDDDIRMKLELIVAELDPEIPSHAKALEKIDNIHMKLDDFELKLDTVLVRLVKATDRIILKINLKKSTYLPFDPRALLLNAGKKYFVNFKSDMLNYMEDDL